MYLATQMLFAFVRCFSFVSHPTGSYVSGAAAESASGGGGATGGVECPRACFCNTLGRIVYCSRRGLAFIPAGIPSDSVQLNLNGNQFQSPVIQRSNFSALSLLEHLYMSECGIERFDDDAFLDLVNLKWLDLSNNRLKALQDNTFRGLRLQHLFLNGNRNIQLFTGSFSGLVTTGLYLHDCSLTHLSPDVLYPLNDSVRYLWLNGNELDRLDPGFSSLFSALLHIRLGSNPLQCDCNALWLKELFDAKVDIFKGAPPPSCTRPNRLRGRFFNESSLYDFRCRPPMFTHIEAIFNATAVRLRCAAVGDPAPTLYWVQPSGRATKYDRPTDAEARDNDGVLEIDARRTGGPVGAAADRDQRRLGMFICIATNVVGNVSLTINVAGSNSQATGGGVRSQTLQTRNTVSWKYLSRTNAREGVLQPTVDGGHINSSSPPAVTSPYSTTVRLQGVPTGFQRLRAVGSTGRPSWTPTMTDTNEAVPTTVEETIAVRRTATYWTDRTFTLTELVGAIVGTHFGTMVAYALIVGACYFRRCRRRQRQIRRIYQRRSAANSHDHHLHESLKVSSSQQLSSSSPCDGSPPPEAVFLNGAGHHRRLVDADGRYYGHTPPSAAVVARARFCSPSSTTTPHQIRR